MGLSSATVYGPLFTNVVPLLFALSRTLQIVIFQQDGASEHYSYVIRVFQWLESARLVWEARLPDIIPLEFFLLFGAIVRILFLTENQKHFEETDSLTPKIYIKIL